MPTNKPNREIDWYRVPLPAETLAALNERSDLKGGIQSIGFLLVLVATGTATFFAWQQSSWVLFTMLLLLHGTVSAFLINGIHELVHGTVFKTKWLNVFFEHVYGFVAMHNQRMFWYSHTEHHKYTLHAPDDLEVVIPGLYSRNAYLKDAFIRLKFYDLWLQQIRYAVGRFDGRWEEMILPETSPNRRKRVQNWSRWILFGHTLICGVSLYYGLWIIPVLFSFPYAYANGIFLLCNTTQHLGLVEDVNDFRLNCRTMYLNPLFRFLYWHMNWHIEHHMYAAVPCYNLAKMHKAIQHALPRCPNGIIQTWVEIAYIQYRQIDDPDYRFIAELPGDNDSFSEKSRLKQIREQANAAKAKKAEQTTSTGSGRRWECTICGFIYEEGKGLPEEGIAPGTAWDDIPDDWKCPDCGVAKSDFEMVEITGQAPANTAEIDTEVDPIIIIGSGLGAYNFARDFRAQNKTQPLMMITAEGGRYYSKPMLSNAISKGQNADDLTRFSAEAMAENLQLEMKNNCRVTAIDRENKRVETEQGSFTYKQLVLATGADPIRLPVKGNAVDSILSINNLRDYEAFTEKLPKEGRILILGAGLIGCEFANDLSAAGHSVSVVDLADRALNRLLPEALSAGLESTFETLGVNWQLGTSVTSVDRVEGGDGLKATLANGETIECDLVLSAVGLRPSLGLAKEAGLEIDRGIVVNAQLQSSDADIYALGDCAQVHGQVLPYIAPLSVCAAALAKTLVGEATDAVYTTMPVMIKTPAFPLVVAPPAMGIEGAWKVEGHAPNLAARFVTHEGQLAGFALSGDKVSERPQLVQSMDEPS